MTAEAERIEQAVDLAAAAHHRQRVRRVAFDAAPHADDVQVAHAGQQAPHLLHLIDDAARLHVGAAVDHVRLAAKTTADDDVAAGDLPEVDHFVRDFGEHADHCRQCIRHRLGHGHLRTMGVQRHGFAKLRGEFLAPGASGDQQLIGAENAPVSGGDFKFVTDLFHMSHFGTLFDPRPGPNRGAGESRCRQTRVGVAIVWCVRAALHVRPEKRKALVQRLPAVDFQVQLTSFRGCCVGFQLGDFVLAIADAHVAAGEEFQVFTDQLRQPLPKGSGAVGEFQLTEMPTLTAHVAEVHAAGILADHVALQQRHRLAALAQKER